MTAFDFYLKRYRIKVTDEIRVSMNDILFGTGYFIYDDTLKLARRKLHRPVVAIVKVTDIGEIVEIYDDDEYAKFAKCTTDALCGLIPKSMFPDEPGSIKEKFKIP